MLRKHVEVTVDRLEFDYGDGKLIIRLKFKFGTDPHRIKWITIKPEEWS